MGENLDVEVAFSYLADLKKKFFSTFDQKKNPNFIFISIKKFFR